VGYRGKIGGQVRWISTSQAVLDIELTDTDYRGGETDCVHARYYVEYEPNSAERGLSSGGLSPEIEIGDACWKSLGYGGGYEPVATRHPGIKVHTIRPIKRMTIKAFSLGGDETVALDTNQPGGQ
jgi:hypothetical protein